MYELNDRDVGQELRLVVIRVALWVPACVAIPEAVEFACSQMSEGGIKEADTRTPRLRVVSGGCDALVNNMRVLHGCVSCQANAMRWSIKCAHSTAACRARRT